VPLGADALAQRLLDEAGVALLSGTAFGAAGESHLRLSYATSRERLAEGLERMGAFLGALRRERPAT
jgi:aspartate/methionine/tyrosine aminotransferase